MPLHALPHELLDTIVSLLSPHSVLQLSQTTRHLRGVCTPHTYHTTTLTPHTPLLTTLLSSYTSLAASISHLTIRPPHPAPASIQTVLSHTRLSSLTLHRTSAGLKLPAVVTLILHRFTASELLHTLAALTSPVHNLRVVSTALNNPPTHHLSSALQTVLSSFPSTLQLTGITALTLTAALPRRASAEAQLGGLLAGALPRVDTLSVDAGAGFVRALLTAYAGGRLRVVEVTVPPHSYELGEVEEEGHFCEVLLGLGPGVEVLKVQAPRARWGVCKALFRGEWEELREMWVCVGGACGGGRGGVVEGWRGRAKVWVCAGKEREVEEVGEVAVVGRKEL